ncbi:hypothetical protein ABZ722_34425 [Streptomyces longwoodensis]|uniref:hypothetical protein n=1 Tax=Streptomyces longwoodensis TaxID=68231 RepID=UPI0033F8CE12
MPVGSDLALVVPVEDQRARQLVNDLRRSRIPRREPNRALAEAFADPDDPTVYKALVRWMRARNR